MAKSKPKPTYPEASARQELLEGAGIAPEAYAMLDERYPNLEDLMQLLCKAGGSTLVNMAKKLELPNSGLHGKFIYDHTDGLCSFMPGEARKIGELLAPRLKQFPVEPAALDQFHKAGPPSSNTIRRRFLAAAALEDEPRFKDQSLSAILYSVVIEAAGKSSAHSSAEHDAALTSRNKMADIEYPTSELAMQLAELLKDRLHREAPESASKRSASLPSSFANRPCNAPAAQRNGNGSAMEL